jgi:hypothetical protein
VSVDEQARAHKTTVTARDSESLHVLSESRPRTSAAGARRRPGTRNRAPWIPLRPPPTSRVYCIQVARPSRLAGPGSRAESHRAEIRVGLVVASHSLVQGGRGPGSGYPGRG